jgi:hypothetical protein
MCVCVGSCSCTHKSRRKRQTTIAERSHALNVCIICLASHCQYIQTHTQTRTHRHRDTHARARARAHTQAYCKACRGESCQGGPLLPLSLQLL